MKPIVGVMPLWDEKKDSIWMLPGYMDGVSQAGGIPIILPLSDDKNEISQLVDICDGLLFTGGQDVSHSYTTKSLLPSLSFALQNGIVWSF